MDSLRDAIKDDLRHSLQEAAEEDWLNEIVPEIADSIFSTLRISPEDQDLKLDDIVVTVFTKDEFSEINQIILRFQHDMHIRQSIQQNRAKLKSLNRPDSDKSKIIESICNRIRNCMRK